MSASLSVRRFWAINFFVLFIFIIIAYQLVQLCAIRRSGLQALADKQHLVSIEIPPIRGQILDRHGKEFAANLQVPSIYAIPRLLENKQRPQLADQVSSILKMDRKTVLNRLSRDKAFVWLKRRVSFEEAEKIRQLGSPALGMVKGYKRFYPQGDLLAQVLGFTDVDSVGLEGIELFLNHELQGRAGRRFTKRDARGREIKAFEIQSILPVDGHNVTLTIDQYLQYLTERALDRGFKQWKAKGAWAIIMEPSTGKILALANRPTYDPNHAETAVADTRRNRAITDMYEPGSVFKIVTASGALNEGKVTPETVIFCENGKYNYGVKVLHDVHSYGDLTFTDVIVKSSNIGTVKAALKLGPDLLASYVGGFGFGKPTGIDFPGEAGGFWRPVKNWSKTTPYNIPMGQEILVTGMQMATALSVIANGGNLVRPYMISEIKDQAGVTLRETRPLVKRRIISPETAKTMREILTKAVEEGTGTKAKIEGVLVGGKTGTAQKILPNGRGYSHSNFMSSFIGFAPADDPKFVMVVVFDDPKPLYYGGTVAAPVFKEVMETALFSMGYASRSMEDEEISGKKEAKKKEASTQKKSAKSKVRQETSKRRPVAKSIPTENSGF